MKIRMIGLMLGAGALAVWGAGCEQPTIDCRATRGSFATKFILTSGSGECSEIKTAIVGLQSYYEKSADANNQVDVTRSSLAIKGGTELVDLVHTLADECGGGEVTTHEFSEGSFASVDPENGICSVPNITASKVVTTEVPAAGDPMDPENICAEPFPAHDVTYEWRNVKVHVSTAGPGNRFEADLTYTDNGCTAQYKVCGVWPVVHCDKLDAEGNAVMGPDGRPAGEDKLCDDQPDLEPQYAIPYGSGINKDFNPKCDPDLLVCVLPTCPIPAE